MSFSDHNKIISGLALLVMVTLMIYSPMFDASFKHMDDLLLIVNNENIRQPNVEATDFLKKPLFHGKAYYRPMVEFSYWLEYRLGGLNATNFYLANIIVHLLNALMLFLVYKSITTDSRLSYLMALFFAIHPVHWEAVTNISGRGILLCSFFLITSFCFFIRAQGRWRWPLYLFALIFFGLALLSKEEAIVFPLVLLAYQVLIQRRNFADLKAWMKSLGSFFVILGIYVLYRRYMGIIATNYWPNVPSAIMAFLTFLRGLITYLRLLFVPLDLYFDRSVRAIYNFFSPEIGLTLGFFILAGWLLFRYRRNISREIWFGGAWFAIFLIPVSQILFAIVPTKGYILMGEHFLYLTSVGFFLGAGHVLKMSYLRNQKAGYVSKRAFWIILASLFIFYALTTLQQSFISSNEVAMYERSLKFNPGNLRVRRILGGVYYKAHKLDAAEMNLRKILEIDPQDIVMRINLGKVLCDQGRVQEGIAEFNKIQEPGLWAGLLYWQMAWAYEALGEWQQAAYYYERLMSAPLDDGRGPYAIAQRLAEIYEKLGDKQKAARYNGIVKEAERVKVEYENNKKTMVHGP